ncbi:MAG: 40S ribosomal protein S17 [Nanoarchaeota archaeon]|nr:40S ribosomal protein S17 [Nanoarchaeota archaeon]
MGKIRSKTVKKTARILLSRDIGLSEDFEINKNIIKGVSPSKKVRNQIAGYAVRLKKQEKASEKLGDN